MRAQRSSLLHHTRNLTALPHAMQFVPFVQGPRNCLGQFFALLEGRVVLALLVKARLDATPPLHAYAARAPVEPAMKL